MSSDPDRTPTRICILASGGGSNARKIMETFDTHPSISTALVISNKPTAGVIQHAFACNVPTLVLTRSHINSSEVMIPLLSGYQVDYIVLAGFLLLVPPYLVQAYPGKILNIHPALLPKFGGKGMYGRHVHQAVKASGETESGMTIHYVNEKFDEGEIIFQDRVPLDPTDSAEDIAARVLQLEHKHYARVISDVIMKDRSGSGHSDS